MVKWTDAELSAMSPDQLKQAWFEEVDEAKAAAEKEDAAAETPEQIAEREAAAAQKEIDDKAADAQKEVDEKAAAEKAAAEKTEQERDEQGRFKKAEDQVPPEDEGEPDEYIYRREIDLGDGSGVEVFEGRGATELEAMQELNDRVIEGKRNANKTIHEFQRKHPKEPEPAKQPEISSDMEYVIKQQLASDKPSEGFKAWFKEAVGMDISEFRDQAARIKAANEAAQRNETSLAVQREFVAAHPEYILSPENGNALKDWVIERNYSDFTRENLEKAFEDLSERGLLKLKTDEASAPTKTEVITNVPEAARIEKPGAEVVTEVAPVRSPKKASSVSSKGSPAPVIKTEPTEDDLYAMPRSKFLELANQFDRV